MPKRSRTGNSDLNQIASNLIDAISGARPAGQPESGKNSASVALEDCDSEYAAAAVMAMNPKTPYFSPLSELLVGTPRRT
jgi:hypothetical protein